ncbi:polycystic kidney disease protein 1-like [Homalodisca vitripennis]|nr:polycystic kidney disease protein 1-like [Homalodisca vitripennis]
MSAICSVCDVLCDDSGEVIKCAGKCGKVLHLKCVASKYPEDSVKTRDSRRKWYCEACKKTKGPSQRTAIDSGRGREEHPAGRGRSHRSGGDTVVAVHRVPTYSRTRTPPIVARFTTRDLRDAWIQAFKKKKTVMACDINYRFSATRIYIGEHLTPDNKQLLRKLKDACKELKIKCVWCREGKFYVRRTEGVTSERVNSVEGGIKFIPMSEMWITEDIRSYGPLVLHVVMRHTGRAGHSCTLTPIYQLPVSYAV